MNAFLLITVMLSAEPTSPAPKMCVVGCLNDGRNGEGVTTCFYDLAYQCRKRQKECKETETLVCEPRAVEIGRDYYRETGETTTTYTSYSTYQSSNSNTY